jgi:hypothetical protein
VCDVAICNRETCWYFYHTPNEVCLEVPFVLIILIGLIPLS